MPNGIRPDDDHEEADAEEHESKTHTDPPSSPQKADVSDGPLITNGNSKRLSETPVDTGGLSSEENYPARTIDLMSEGVSLDGPNDALPTGADTDERLEALAKERAALREEVAQVRRSLEEIQGKHEEELGNIREQLAETQVEKEQAETQYRNLLGKVNTIRSQLGERLKADAVGGFSCRMRFITHDVIGRSVAGTQSDTRSGRPVQKSA